MNGSSRMRSASFRPRSRSRPRALRTDLKSAIIAAVQFSLQDILAEMVQKGASDLHLKARTPVYLRLQGELVQLDHPSPSPQELEDLAHELLTDSQLLTLQNERQTGSMHVRPPQGERFRLSVSFQRGTLGFAFRHIPATIPPLQQIGIPEEGAALLEARQGILLVTGPASSGKTTTVASLIEAYNQTREGHIVTLEDPIEYVLTSKSCLINQRQIGTDTESFETGLRHVLRQDPDIIYVGELRDLVTTSIALAAAETGHLVISTLHTPDATTTMEQLIGLFPSSQQAQARLRLSLALSGIISQQLISMRGGTGRVAAFEVLAPHESIRNLIRTNQTFRIGDALQTSQGCRPMRQSLAELAQQGHLSMDDIERYSTD